MTAATKIRSMRVACYTRKSVTEGLDQAFNSLDAQKEAVDAYVKSQAGDGWVLLAESYDDGGFSGANMERPAFQRLLRDVEAGAVDAIAVYRLDRLSRSIADFSQLIRLLDKHGVAFISVSERFDTSTPMGRMVLNLLATFAQFERETIAQRTKDKMGAARRRGMWTGGRPVLGFDVVDKHLVVNESEAEHVRRAFRLYLELGSTMGVAEELATLGIRNKVWTNAAGAKAGGRAFGKGTIKALLRNPLYAGLVRGPDGHCPGEQDSIVPQDLWDAVQARFDAGTKEGRRPRRTTSDALLAGIARCHCGSALTPTRARKGGRVYLYYACVRAQKEGASACPGSRVSGEVLEGAVIESVRNAARNPHLLSATIAAAASGHEEERRELTERTSELQRARGALAKRRGHIIAFIETGDGGAGLTDRVRVLDAEIAAMDERVRVAKVELAGLHDAHLEPEHIREALAQFDGLWESLSLAERARAANLLLRNVVYDGRTGSIDIELRIDEGGEVGATA